MRPLLILLAAAHLGCGGGSFEVAEVNDADAGTADAFVADEAGPDVSSGDTLGTSDGEPPPDAGDAVTDVARETSADVGGDTADALPCSAPVKCWPDADGDGYAPAGAPHTLACECPTNTTTRSPSLTIDCNDEDSRVHPGAGFQPAPYCVPGTACATKSFDYDCSSTEDRQYPSAFGGCTTSPCGGAGWTSTVPPCGGSAGWTFCKAELLGCSKDTSTTMKQGCR